MDTNFSDRRWNHLHVDVIKYIISEWNDREIFNSHCANTWLASQKRCESLGSSLTIFTKERRDLLYNTSAKYVWNGQFFTPWIWSDGKY